ncbi:MAG: patatin-like phospholipase family protein [Thermoanaerobaculia bacterium]
MNTDRKALAMVLTGGGARAAYQVGILRCLARHFPEAKFPLLTGVSAGAINAAYLAASATSLPETVEGLTAMWADLTPEKVFRVDSWSLLRNFLRWGLRLSSGGAAAPQVRGLLDTSPLRCLLTKALAANNGIVTGIGDNLEGGQLRAFATSTVRFSTGQTVTWVQGSQMEDWERPGRLGLTTQITVEHIMASSALPLIFPATRLGDAWYGDGGVRNHTPLAPAIHLGADRILAVSTRHLRSSAEFEATRVDDYPPPAQLAGVLLNAIFLDAVDQDAAQLERINRLISLIPETDLGRLRPVKLMVLRPSVDLGRLAANFEPRLPRAFRFLTRGLGTHQLRSPDFLSLLMFQPDYLTSLIEIGEKDAEASLGDLEALMTA